MKTKYFFIGVAALCIFINTNAQQNTSFNLYFLNPAIYNPASAANSSGYTVYSNYRHQWIGLNGSPEYIKFGIYSSIKNNMGISINASGFRNGMLNNNELNASYSYLVRFSERQHLSFGLSYGLYRFGINRTSNEAEIAIDPAVNISIFDKSFFKTGFGLSYGIGNWQIDVAVPELYDQSKKSYFSSVYSFVSYEINIDEGKFVLKPIAGYRNYYQSTSQLDIGMIAMLQKKFWVHLGYRTKNNMLFSAGVTTNKVSFAYSYEMSSSVMASVSGGSNEISLLFNFGKAAKKGTTLFHKRTNDIPGNKFK